MNDRQRASLVSASPGVLVEPEHAVIDAKDLVPFVVREFERRGEVVPCEEKMTVLCRVISGYLRTTPVEDVEPDARSTVVAAFVAVWPSWWTSDHGDYPLLATLLEDVFHQRELPAPGTTALEVLHGLSVDIMRGKRLPSSPAAQLAIADWMACLYLAGTDDW